MWFNEKNKVKKEEPQVPRIVAIGVYEKQDSVMFKGIGLISVYTGNYLKNTVYHLHPGHYFREFYDFEINFLLDDVKKYAKTVKINSIIF